jgi:ubiquinone/menaquinone biosynthesis C-methylase UbiE
MDKNTYKEELNKLTAAFERIPNTPMAMFFKVLNLATLNLRYEKIAFSKTLPAHPYLLTRRLISDQLAAFCHSMDILFSEGETQRWFAKNDDPNKENKHRDLFNLLWNKYDRSEYRQYVDRYKLRIRVNHLRRLIKDKRCLDLGCGNGNFCFALADLGARQACGIDFGADSIAFANQIRRRRKNGARCAFKVASVYTIPYPKDSFDFIIQNGVFHHLNNEKKAIMEAKRVLKPGGYFWYYTDGEGGISYDLWDRSVFLLRKVPKPFMQSVLHGMNISTNKMVHVMDGLSATYRHTSWKKMTGVLSQAGFGDFKRLTGGFKTDFDLDAIEADPYGRMKFGEGDLRILARLVKK